MSNNNEDGTERIYGLLALFILFLLLFILY